MPSGSGLGGVESLDREPETADPEELKGPPSTEPQDLGQLRSAIVQDNLGYTTLAEEWNEYIDEEGTRKDRLGATSSPPEGALAR